MNPKFTARWLIAAGGFVGLAAGLVLLASVLGGEASRKDFEDNAGFLKHGRSMLAICLSDVTTDPGRTADVSHIEGAIAANRDSLWDGSFLEQEPITVESPCASGPSFGSEMTDVRKYLSDIRVVAQPGPYLVNVYVVDGNFLKSLAKLNLGRVTPYEFVDSTPGQPGGFQQVSAAFYLSADELGDLDFVARNLAEALGCTEECAATAE